MNASVEYVRRGTKMEDTSIEVKASCGHPVDVRFPVGTTEQDRNNGLAEVVGQPCTFCGQLEEDRRRNG